MCTLSLFQTKNGFRVFMNRDERHDRTPELSPRVIKAKNNIFGPVDPVSNGTWIAYNKHGFWGCLLNGYFENENTTPHNNTYTSRGAILPSLLMNDNPLEAAKTITPTNHLSFRLLIGSPTHYALYEWNGQTYREIDFHAHHEERAFFLSSSSWKQDKVIEIRKGIFEQWVSKHTTPPEHIPDFHLDTRPTPESAPLMTRSYSGTKSITALNIENNSVTMHYHKVENQTIISSEKELEYT